MIGWIKSLFKEQKKDDVFVPPETRIEAITQRNGEKIYIPQVRVDGLWLNVDAFVISKEQFGKEGTLTYSQNVLDAWIKFEKGNWDKKAMKVEYVKYP